MVLAILIAWAAAAELERLQRTKRRSRIGLSGRIMAGSWGCPHETNDVCSKVNNLPCDPGMKGCVLHGRYVFANDDKNERLRQKQARAEGAADAIPPASESI